MSSPQPLLRNMHQRSNGSTSLSNSCDGPRSFGYWFLSKSRWRSGDSAMSSWTSWSTPGELFLLIKSLHTNHAGADELSLALFLGTGNATPDLPTVMMERLYTSPTYGMWYPIDPKSLSSNLPPMVVFPEETKFYTKWKETLEERGVKVSSLSPIVWLTLSLTSYRSDWIRSFKRYCQEHLK